MANFKFPILLLFYQYMICIYYNYICGYEQCNIYGPPLVSGIQSFRASHNHNHISNYHSKDTMNISLSSAGNKKQKKGGSSLAFGLNNRKKSTNPSSNVFGDDGDSSDNDSDDGTNHGMSRRDVVNKQIAREQAALRRRAQADLASANDTAGVYDYDGAYDSFRPTAESTAKPEVDKEKKSKYIGDLLKAAKVRERERDAIYERRNAREQAEEEANADYRGKEKFVTKSYKRKLQERKQWEAEQEQKEREEEANDVTKKAAGSAFAGFYGNLNRSAMTEQTSKSDEVNDSVGGKGQEDSKPSDDDDDFDPRQGFLGGFERSSQPDTSDANKDGFATVQDEDETKAPTLSMREIREKKVAEARVRYLQRKQSVALGQ